jgi:hypothetical protein
MKQKKTKNGNGLNKLVYDRDENPVDGVKLPFEELAMLCEEGEKLGVQLARDMMGYGFDYYGTFVRTYALSQMVACLKVFAKDKGFDAMAMFDILTPRFTKEAEEMLEEIKAEEHEQQKCGYMFLDLNTAVGAKEFKKILKNLESE